MSMVTTKVGRQKLAGMMNGTVNPSSPDMRVILFKNDIDPDPDTVYADLVTCEFGGYSQVMTTWLDATGPTLVGDDAVLRLTGNPIAWDCTSDPETIYGWAFFDGNSDDLYFVEKYETPHVLEVGSRHTLFADVGVGACA